MTGLYLHEPLLILTPIFNKSKMPGIVGIMEDSKKVHSGSAVTASKQVLRAARNLSTFSGATVMLTWRLMPWNACESSMCVDMPGCSRCVIRMARGEVGLVGLYLQ